MTARLGSEIAHLERRGGGLIRLVLPDVDDREDDIAEALGFIPGRDRWRLRVALPASTSNLSVRPWGPDDAGIGAYIEEQAPGWRLAGTGGDVPLEGEGSDLLMLHVRQDRLIAFARAHLGSSARLLGFGVIPEAVKRPRSLPSAMVLATLQHLERLGYGSVDAEVDPGDFDVSSVLEASGFRYHSATRSYDRKVEPVAGD